METVNTVTKRAGCPDLDPDWPDIFGKPRGPRVCVLYPNCRCGKEDAERLSHSAKDQHGT